MKKQPDKIAVMLPYRQLSRLAAVSLGLFGVLWLWMGVLEILRSDNDFAIKLQDFITITLSIVIEALPFVILGVLLSTVIHFFVSSRWLLRRLPKGAGPRRAVISMAGIFLPVCECGNVPVVRELIRKGFTPAEATTFLLAAPIANPVTILSTWAAFSFAPGIPVVRLLGGLAVANLIGWAIARWKNQQSVLTPAFVESCKRLTHTHRSATAFLDMFRREFSLLLGVLCFGAMIAAASQIFIPTEVLTTVGNNPVLSVLALMGLAFIVSICASFDAFFALAYVSTFSTGSLLAFMIFGPMVDIKMLALMRTTYRTKFLLGMAVAIALIVGVSAILFNYALQFLIARGI